MTQAQFVGRLEDARLLTGAGRYASDWSYPDQLHAVFLRADRAHAEILSINTEAARNHPGVAAVLTHEDVSKAGFGTMPVNIPPKHRDGRPTWKAQRPVLAQDRVRHVGECLACVVAQSHQIALDALELIEVQYRDLPAVADAAEALEPGAPQIHREVAGNLYLDWETGDAAKTDDAFARAAHRVSLGVNNTRVMAQPMEPRSSVAVHDKASDVTTLHCPTQGVGLQITMLAGTTGLAKEKLNVVVRDVGGGFGARTTIYPEYVAVLLAARLLGRPVKWTGTRSEVFLNDMHGRDCHQRGELALDANGRFLAMRFDFIQGLGAYSSLMGANAPTVGATVCLTGQYQVPVAYNRVRIAITNTTSTAAYRGAGRPLMSYIVERLVDQAAVELNIDPAELRRRNLVPRESMPYQLPNGTVYDCGDFPAVLKKALKKADWARFDARLAGSQKRGRLRGRGIATFIEGTAEGRAPEAVMLRFERDGSIALYGGAQSQGQSHETTFAQIVSEATGIPMQRFVLKSGDGTRIAGSPSGGSKTLVHVGGAFNVAAGEIVAKGMKLAAQALEAPEQDIEFGEGQYRIRGTDRRIGLLQLIDRHTGTNPHPLDTSSGSKFSATYPNSCHICEVEIDPDTGLVEVKSYSGVDDAGRIINHQVVEGQMHGGTLQGAGQVLSEYIIYDQDGQLLTGSFMDYPMPRATSFVEPQLEDLPTYTGTNPLGAKGVGESGVTGALPTVMNAVMDALRRGGVTQFDMPATPQRVWAALQAAGSGAR